MLARTRALSGIQQPNLGLPVLLEIEKTPTPRFPEIYFWYPENLLLINNRIINRMVNRKKSVLRLKEAIYENEQLRMPTKINSEELS